MYKNQVQQSSQARSSIDHWLTCLVTMLTVIGFIVSVIYLYFLRKQFPIPNCQVILDKNFNHTTTNFLKEK